MSKTVGGVVTFYLYDGDDLIAELDGSGNINGCYVCGALGLISDHAGAGSEQNNFSLNFLPPSSQSVASGRHSHFAACTEWEELLQGASSSDRFYTFDAQGSTNGLVRGGLNGGFFPSPCFTPWGSGNLGDSNSSPFGYKGQRGGYTDRESHLIIMESDPYVPAAPAYTAPYSYHDATPYQPMSGNPVGSGQPYDDNAIVAGGPEDGVCNAASGLGAIGLGGGGPNGYQMWRDFMNHVMHAIPLGDLFMAFNGMDMGGCKFSNKDRLSNVATGLMSAAPVLGHFGGIIAPGAEAAEAATICPTKPYNGPGGGHHIHAKAAFLPNPLYDVNEGLCVSNEEMAARGWNHMDEAGISAAQRRLFDELARDVAAGRKSNTLSEHSRIAYEALIAGGATPEDAASAVVQSLRQLRRRGITGPSKIPWH